MFLRYAVGNGENEKHWNKNEEQQMSWQRTLVHKWMRWSRHVKILWMRVWIIVWVVQEGTGNNILGLKIFKTYSTLLFYVFEATFPPHCTMVGCPVRIELKNESCDPYWLGMLKMASRETIPWSHECSPLLGVFCV